MEFNIVEELLGLTMLGSEWVLWLLLALSILSVALVLERLIFFYRMKIDFQAFSSQLTEYMVRKDLEGAERFCQGNPSLESQTALKAFYVKDKGKAAVEQNTMGYLVGRRQVLDRGLIILGTLGNNAPFIGLFGTVIGIIKAFHDLSLNPAGGPSVVMAGISEALVSTALGLLVAIPAVVAFNSFQRLVKRHMANAESVVKIILTHFGN